MCRFYSEYVLSDTSKKEPTQNVYTDLIDTLSKSVGSLDNYKDEDSAYVKLVLYKQIMDLLNDQRKGFAQLGVDKNKILGLFDEIENKTKSMFVTQEASIEMKQDIEENYRKFIENINRTYQNT